MEVGDAHTPQFSPGEFSLARNSALSRAPAAGLLLGVLGLVGAVVFGQSDLRRLHFSLHVSGIYFLTLGLGGLWFVLVQFATRSGWSVAVRRLAENLGATLPILALCVLIPMALGMESLFHHWLGEGAGDPVIAGKSAYLNPGFFWVRACLYVVIWSGLAWFFRLHSLAQDSSRDPALTYKMQRISYPGIAAFGLSITFAAFDWIMSLDPHWYSTIFGVYFLAGIIVAVQATLPLYVSVLRGHHGEFARRVTKEHGHDMGKLLFGFLCFWAYIAFSQFFLQWYGNLPEEQVWFARRNQGGWETLSAALIVGHFGAPFLFLLPRKVKRTWPLLIAGSVWMLSLHFLDLFWLIMPQCAPGGGFGVTPADICAFLGLGGLFAGALAFFTLRVPLVPVGDPRLPESFAFENQ